MGMVFPKKLIINGDLKQMREGIKMTYEEALKNAIEGKLFLLLGLVFQRVLIINLKMKTITYGLEADWLAKWQN